jgi:hypothetical protein
MKRALTFSWRHKGAAGALAVAAAAALAAFDYALALDEGRIKHIRKLASEAAAMPGRLLT